jgi:hypothetical protein
MYSDQQIADLAAQMESKGASDSDIEGFVQAAKAEQSQPPQAGDTGTGVAMSGGSPLPSNNTPIMSGTGDASPSLPSTSASPTGNDQAPATPPPSTTQQTPSPPPHPSLSPGSNLPGSLADLGIGAAKGVASTISGASELGQNMFRPINNAVLGLFGQQQAPTATLPKEMTTPSNTSQQVGFTGEHIAEYLLPLTKAMEAGKITESVIDAANLPSWLGGALKVGAKAGIEGATSGAVTAAQEGSVNQNVATSAALGAAFPVAGAALKTFGGVAGEVAKTFASTLSGVPANAIQHAFENPEAVQSAIKAAVADGPDTAGQKVLQQAQDALKELKTARSQAYQEQLANIQKTGNIPNLDISGIKQTAVQTLEKFGGSVENGTLDASGMAIDKSHASQLQDVLDRINNWKDTSPTGVNQLRRIIDSYQPGGINPSSSEKQFGAMLTNMSNDLNSHLVSKVPQIGAMNQAYAAQSKVINNITDQLSMNSKNPNTALRKLLNVFNPKSTVYKPIVEELGRAGGNQLMSDIAGVTMSKWTPEGIGKWLLGAEGIKGAGDILTNPAGAAAGLPVAAATAAASSPRIVGAAATGLGKIAQTEIPAALPTIGKAAVQAMKPK